MSDIVLSNGKENESKVSAKIQNDSLSVFHSAFATVMFIVLQILMSWFTEILPSSLTSIFIVAFLVSILVEAVFGFAGVFTCKIANANIAKTTKLNKKPTLIGAFIAVGLALICLMFFNNLTNAFVLVLNKLGYSQVISDIQIPNIFIYLVYVILLAVSPAFFEEFLFRGVILRGFEKHGTHTAVILSALIFSLMHGGPDQTIHQFVLGVVMGYAYHYSGSLWVPIIIHFVNNFTAVTSLFFTTLISGGDVNAIETVTYSWAEVGMVFIQGLVMSAFGAVLVVLCIKGLKKVCSKNIENKQELVMEIDGEVIRAQSENSSQEKKKDTMKIWTILLFVTSGIYFILEWVTTLLIGLGVIAQ